MRRMNVAHFGCGVIFYSSGVDAEQSGFCFELVSRLVLVAVGQIGGGKYETVSYDKRRKAEPESALATTPATVGQRQI